MCSAAAPSSSIELASLSLSVGGVAVGDGSWELRVHVTDLQVERTLRVRGDLHVGGLMIRLVDELGRSHLGIGGSTYYSKQCCQNCDKMSQKSQSCDPTLSHFFAIFGLPLKFCDFVLQIGGIMHLLSSCH